MQVCQALRAAARPETVAPTLCSSAWHTLALAESRIYAHTGAALNSCPGCVPNEGESLAIVPMAMLMSAVAIAMLRTPTPKLLVPCDSSLFAIRLPSPLAMRVSAPPPPPLPPLPPLPPSLPPTSLLARDAASYAALIALSTIPAVDWGPANGKFVGMGYFFGLATLTVFAGAQRQDIGEQAPISADSAKLAPFVAGGSLFAIYCLLKFTDFNPATFYQAAACLFACEIWISTAPLVLPPLLTTDY